MPAALYAPSADGSGSGRTEDPSRAAGSYVLSGVVVHESKLWYLEAEIARLKHALFPDDKQDSLEFHAQEIWNSHGSFRSDKYNLLFEEKWDIFDRAVGLACSLDMQLINTVADKSSTNGMKGRCWPLERSWIDMVKAFKRQLTPKSGTEYGLIIEDASESVSEQIVAKTVCKTARRCATREGRSPVFDGAFFRDSRLESAIQLADLIGYVVHKRVKGDPVFSAWHGHLEHNPRNCPRDAVAGQGS